MSTMSEVKSTFLGDKPLANQKRKRTKTGCITCRIRRIKCDEGKPSCVKCTSTGRRCDGYSLPYPHVESTPQRLALLVSPGVDQTKWDVRARSAFHFFYAVCAPTLVNYGSDRFWNKLVLQASMADDSIKHLIIAASSLDRQARTPYFCSSTLPNAVFLSHYGKALKLIAKTQNPSTTVVLVACLLLIVCEELQKNRFGALQHIFAARRIILGYTERRSLTNYDTNIDELSSIFQQIELQTAELDQETMPEQIRWDYEHDQPSTDSEPDSIDLQYDKELSEPHDRNPLAAATTSLQELVPLCVYRRTDMIAPYSSFHVVPLVTQKLNKWLNDFNKLCRTMNADDVWNCYIDIHILRLHYMCLNIMSRCAPFSQEKLYDQYWGQFGHLSKVFVHFLARDSREEVSHKLLGPIFFTAAHCRDLDTRKQAIDSLKLCSWAGIRLATIAKQIAQIEEGNEVDLVVCDDIPEERRIRVVAIDFTWNEVSEETSGILIFERSPFSNFCDELYEHHFRWPDIKDKAVQASVKQLLRRVLDFDFS